MGVSLNIYEKGSSYVDMCRHFRKIVEDKNDLVTRKKVLKMIWGNNDYFIGRSMDVFIARLRKYLKADPNVKILTVHGVGFRLVVAEPVEINA